jgi:hypothetical protein
VIAGLSAGVLFGWIPQPMPRFIALLGLAAVATTLWTLWGHPWLLRRIFRRKSPTDLGEVSAARRRMS